MPIAALTGGTGFLGRHVVTELLREGWHIRLLMRRETTTFDGAVTAVRGDLETGGSLRRLVQGASAVIHLAGLVKARGAAEFFAVNRDGAARLAGISAREAPTARFVLVSSQAARQPELSAYAASKRAGEAAVIAALGTAVPWVVLRPGVIYGPGDHEGAALLRLARRRIAPTVLLPAPRIAMIHAADAAAAIVALSRGGPSGVVYELTDARVDGYGWTELLHLIGAAFGRRPYCLPLPDLLHRTAGAMSDGLAALSGRPSVFGRGKVREFLHRDWSSDARRQPAEALWRPMIDLQSGLEGTVAWWRARNGKAKGFARPS